MKNFYKLLVTSSVAFAGLMPSSAMAAGASSVSLTSSAGTVTKGSTFTVSVFENGTGVTYVNAKLTFDPGKLSCSGVSGSAAFSASTPDTGCGGGVASVSYSAAGGTTPAPGSMAGSVKFTALSDIGDAVVAVSAGTQLGVNGKNDWNGATSSVSVSLVAPVANTEPGRGQRPDDAPQQTTATNKKAAVASTTGNATSTDTSSATTEAPKAEEKQVASAADDKQVSNAQAATPAVAKSNGKAIAFVSVLAVATAAALAFIYRQKLSAVLVRAKEA